MSLQEQFSALLANPVNGERLPPAMHSGKVRLLYETAEHLVMVHTDKVSAFDRAVGTIPGKGALLATLSAWWFQHLEEAIPHHFLEQPDPNILVCRKLKMIPVEVVVRGYLTGSTKTSIWSRYQSGERAFGGITLPNGLAFNAPLPEPVLTPTTKDPAGDRNLEPAELIRQGWVSKDLWTKVADRALHLFKAGNKIAKSRGIQLVDTKYEFGLDPSGEVVLADELHTPDSSRFWKLDGDSQLNYDKEALRLWLKERANPYTQDPLPPLPRDLRLDLALKYAELFHYLTGTPFKPETNFCEPETRILQSLAPLSLSKNLP